MNAQLDKALWYLGRGTGVSALVLLTTVLLLGILVRSSRTLPGVPRFTAAAVHRTVSLLAVSFVAVHVLTLLLDPKALLNVTDVIVPFVGSYRPLWQGLGTLAFDVLLALVVTSLLRHRIGLRTWRGVHWFAYACWPFAVAHALGNGTDSGSRWLLVIVIACITAVVGAGVWRLVGTDFGPPPTTPLDNAHPERRTTVSAGRR